MTPRLLLVMLFAACAREGVTAPVETLAPSATAPASAAARWVEARRVSALPLLEGPARVLPGPGSAAVVVPPVEARVTRVRVRAGQTVAVGEPLIDVLMPQVVQAAGAQAAARIRLDALGRRRSQLEALKAEGLVRLGDLAELEAQSAVAQADLVAATATLRGAGVNDKAATALLASEGQMPLASPIAGLVTSVDVTAGEVRQPSGRPCVEVVAPGDLRIEARWSAELPPEARAEFVGHDGATVPLVLISTSPRVESTDGARLAWFALETAGGPSALRAGAAGRVRVVPESTWRVVPAQALRSSGQGHELLVRTASGSAWRPVVPLLTSGADAVVSGLDGDVEVAASAPEREGAK